MFGYADRLANCGCFLCFLEHIFLHNTGHQHHLTVTLNIGLVVRAT